MLTVQYIKITAVMKVETDNIPIIAESLIGCVIILVVMHYETFKTDTFCTIIFKSYNIICLMSR